MECNHYHVQVFGIFFFQDPNEMRGFRLQIAALPLFLSLWREISVKKGPHGWGGVRNPTIIWLKGAQRKD